MLLQVSETSFPCWLRAATGMMLAVVCWGGYLGLRTATRQYRDGRVTAARVTGAVSVIGAFVAMTLVWVGLSATF